MSMARLILPPRLELKRPEGSFNAAPLAKVILTAFLYVSPVQTIPSWDQTGIPHFHSSTISGSALCMISRTFASIFPRQSPSSLILSSINAEADCTASGFFICSSNSWQLISCAERRNRRRTVGSDAAGESETHSTAGRQSRGSVQTRDRESETHGNSGRQSCEKCRTQESQLF